MEDWKLIRLGDVISIKSGFAYKGEYIGNGDAYLLGMGCVSYKGIFLLSGARKYNGETPERYLAKPGDIVLATRQQSDNLPILGMPAMIPYSFNGEKVIIGANLYRVENHSDISNEFLFWLLKSPAYVAHIRSCQTGTTVRMITKANIEDFTFLCPPKSERQRIASTLWNIEKKIELNNRINHNLEEQAQALFDDWCSTCHEKKTIGELAANILDYSKNTCSKVILVNSSDVTEGKFESLPYSENENLKGQFKKRFQKGDILFSEIRPRNKHYALCYFNADEYIASTRLIVLRHNANLIGSSTLLYQYIKSCSVQEGFIAKTESRSGTFPQGNYADLASEEVPYSEDNKQLSDLLDGVYKQIWSNLKENDNLVKQRDELLPRLMSGELTC